MELVTLMNREKENYNNKLMVSIQAINVLLGSLITLLGVVFYSAIKSEILRVVMLALLVALGITVFIILCKHLYFSKEDEDKSNIRYIKMVNEDNNVIEKWNVEDKISFVIGKSTKDEKVFIDLNSSIYSNLIEDKHAVLNYAEGRWYIEDLSEKSGISILKKNDDVKYRMVKGSPCEIKKGDILYISKVKLLLE